MSQGSSLSCADPESFVRGSPNLTKFFLYSVVERRDDPYTTKSGPSSIRTDDGPTLNDGFAAL